MTVLNRYEVEALSRRDGLVAVTLGAEGAMLLEDGKEVARAVRALAAARDGAEPSLPTTDEVDAILSR